MDASTVAGSLRPETTRLQTFALFVNFFFPSLALIVVAIRAAGRLATHQFALDDWLVSIAMLMSIAETAISYFCTCHRRVTPRLLTDNSQLSRPTSLAFRLNWYRPTTRPRA